MMSTCAGRLSAVRHSCKLQTFMNPRVLFIKCQTKPAFNSTPLRQICLSKNMNISPSLLTSIRSQKFVTNHFFRGFRSRSNLTKKTVVNSQPPPDHSNLVVLMKYGCLTLGFVLGCYGCVGISQCKKLKENEIHELWTNHITKEKPSKFNIYIDDKILDTNLVKLLALNTAVFLLWKSKPLLLTMNKWFTLSAVPGIRNFPSMLLSTFSHKLLFHLCVNMYVLKGFMTPWNSFESDQKLQGLSRFEMFFPFYLSAGVTASLLSFTVKVITKTSIASVGASGAIMALLSYACTRYPNSQLSIILLPNLPFSAEAGLNGIILFDSVGLALMLLRNFISFQSPFDHAGHLGGALFGMWYAKGGEEVLMSWIKFVCDKWNKYVLNAKDN